MGVLNQSKNRNWWTRELESPLVNALLGTKLAEDLNENTINIYVSKKHSPTVEVNDTRIHIPYNKAHPAGMGFYGKNRFGILTYTPETLWSEAKVENYDKLKARDYFFDVVENLKDLHEKLEIKHNDKPVDVFKLHEYKGKTLDLKLESKQYKLVVKDQ